MLRVDFFDFFRHILALVVTVYATVVTLQSLWGWYFFLKGQDKYVAMMRRYLVVQGLRLRFKSFWGDVLVCLLLCVTFVIMWRAHQVIYEVGERIRDVRNAQ